MIILLRGSSGSERLDLARKVADAYEWAATVLYPADQLVGRVEHRALICGSGVRRGYIPGMVLTQQQLYDQALLHHGWGADCVLCVDDDEKRQLMLTEAGIDCYSILLVKYGERRKNDVHLKLLKSGGRSTPCSAEDALKGMTQWLGLKHENYAKERDIMLHSPS